MVRVYFSKLKDESRDHKVQSRGVRQLLNKALERDYPQVCTPVLLEKEVRGKPFLAEYPKLHISLSHSGVYVACAIADQLVGVDVEARRHRSGWERVIKKFHPQERAALEQTEEAEREALFYDLWVLKESFIKVDGQGFGVPLNSFCMEARTGEVWKAEKEIQGRDYFYRLYHLEGEECRLAVCSLDSEIAEQPVEIHV